MSEESWNAKSDDLHNSVPKNINTIDILWEGVLNMKRFGSVRCQSPRVSKVYCSNYSPMEKVNQFQNAYKLAHLNKLQTSIDSASIAFSRFSSNEESESPLSKANSAWGPMKKNNLLTTSPILPKFSKQSKVSCERRKPKADKKGWSSQTQSGSKNNRTRFEYFTKKREAKLNKAMMIKKKKESRYTNSVLNKSTQKSTVLSKSKSWVFCFDCLGPHSWVSSPTQSSVHLLRKTVGPKSLKTLERC